MDDMQKKKYYCNLGEIDYSVDGKPKLVNQNWRIREDLNETIAIFIRDSLKKYFKKDIAVHIPYEEVMKNELKVKSGEMSEEERSIIEKSYKNAWIEKVSKVIFLFDEYVKNYWKTEFSSSNDYIEQMEAYNKIAKDGLDRLKEVFDELIL